MPNERRISYGSSDVCSSDLCHVDSQRRQAFEPLGVHLVCCAGYPYRLPQEFCLALVGLHQMDQPTSEQSQDEAGKAGASPHVEDDAAGIARQLRQVAAKLGGIEEMAAPEILDRKRTRLNSSH